MRDYHRFGWPRHATGRAAAAITITAVIAALAAGCGSAGPPHAAPGALPLPSQPAAPSAPRARAADACLVSATGAADGGYHLRDHAYGADGSDAFRARDGDRAAPGSRARGLHPSRRAAGGDAARYRTREPDMGPGRAVPARMGPVAAADASVK
jgi:hypothetical protein